MKKVLAIFFALLFVTLSFFSCGEEEPPTQGREEDLFYLRISYDFSVPEGVFPTAESLSHLGVKELTIERTPPRFNTADVDVLLWGKENLPRVVELLHSCAGLPEREPDPTDCTLLYTAWRGDPDKEEWKKPDYRTLTIAYGSWETPISDSQLEVQLKEPSAVSRHVYTPSDFPPELGVESVYCYENIGRLTLLFSGEGVEFLTAAKKALEATDDAWDVSFVSGSDVADLEDEPALEN